MSRVALVYPYFRTRAPTELLFPPLGAAVLTSQLAALGVESKIFDCTFMNFSTVRSALKSYGPRIVGIYSMITMSRSALRIAEELRTLLPDCLLVAGGPLPTLYPDQYAKRFDAVFRGEADVAFPAFCQDFISQNLSRDRLSEMPLEKYPGLFIRQTGLQADSPAVHYSEKELSGFPIPLCRFAAGVCQKRVRFPWIGDDAYAERGRSHCGCEPQRFRQSGRAGTRILVQRRGNFGIPISLYPYFFFDAIDGKGQVDY